MIFRFGKQKSDSEAFDVGYRERERELFHIELYTPGSHGIFLIFLVSTRKTIPGYTLEAFYLECFCFLFGDHRLRTFIYFAVYIYPTAVFFAFLCVCLPLTHLHIIIHIGLGSMSKKVSFEKKKRKENQKA